jgi:hypothetical protein
MAVAVVEALVLVLALVAGDCQQRAGAMAWG